MMNPETLTDYRGTKLHLDAGGVALWGTMPGHAEGRQQLIELSHRVEIRYIIHCLVIMTSKYVDQ